MAFNHDIQDPLERIKNFMAFIIDPNNQYWDSQLHSLIEPVSATLNKPASTSTSTFSVGPIPRNICNRMHNAHGGSIATLFDLLTTIAMAPLSRPGAFEFAGVSRTLNCAYLRPVPMDSTVLVVCEAVSLGRRLCAIIARITDEKGRVYATCEHHKVSVDPAPEKEMTAPNETEAKSRASKL